MSNGNGNGSNKREWIGKQRFEHYDMIAESFRVNRENGNSCNGTLTVYDEARRRRVNYLWTAAYRAPGQWQVTGRENGEMGDIFSPNPGVNHALTAFTREKLNQMRECGAIFQHPPNPTGINGAKQPSSPPPAPPAPPKPAASTPATAETATDKSRPPEPPASQPKPTRSDIVAEAVCAEYGVTRERMCNSRKRGPENQLCWARAVIIYLLRELGEEAPAVLSAIGASEKANSAFYRSYDKVTERMSRDAEFRVMINRLRVKVGLNLVATAVVDKQTEANHQTESLPKDSPNMGDQLAGRVLSLVSRFVFEPWLLGRQGLILKDDDLRAIAVYLLFQQGLSPEQISSISAFNLDEVYRKIGKAAVLLKGPDGAAKTLVNEVEKGLGSK